MARPGAAGAGAGSGAARDTDVDGVIADARIDGSRTDSQRVPGVGEGDEPGLRSRMAGAGRPALHAARPAQRPRWPGQSAAANVAADARGREREEEGKRERKGGPIRKTGLGVVDLGAKLGTKIHGAKLGAKIQGAELGAKIHGTELIAMSASTPPMWPRPRRQNLWRLDV